MIPDMGYVDYAVILISFVFCLGALLPCLPTLLLSYFKQRGLQKKFKFSLTSGTLAYGVTILIYVAILTPFEIINTFLSPSWESMGHSDFVYYIFATERIISEFLPMVLVIILSIIVPFKLMKSWRVLTDKVLLDKVFQHHAIEMV